MKLFGTNGLFYHLIDGIIIAFSGTNKEKLRKGIVLTIAMIFIYVLIWLGLSCFGYKPTLSLIDIQLSLASLMGGLISAIVGGILLVVAGIWGVVYIICIIFLFFGSFIALIKKKQNDGSPLAAFIVNFIGLIIIILIPVIFII